MRFFYKYIIRCLKLGSLARALRHSFYRIFDFLGDKIFFILRTCHLLPPIKEFDEKLVKKILIIRLDRIGDVILSTPAIRAVRETFPNREIHFLVTPYTKDLVVNNSNLDRISIFKKDNLDKDYDLAVALHPGIMQNYLTFISGAKFRLGYTGWGGEFFLTQTLKDDRAKIIRHEVEWALEAVGMTGCKIDDKSLEISITEYGERFVEDFFKQNNLSPGGLIIAVHPGARQAYIRWKKEGFAEVGDRLIKEENAKVILVGNERERHLAKDIVSLMKERPLLAMGLRLTQLISLIKRCALFIGNSTGPMHIAAALKVPVVAIFGSIHPFDSYKTWGPWGDKHIVISKDLNCPECHPTDCRTFDCMRLITADQVFEAAKRQISR